MLAFGFQSQEKSVYRRGAVACAKCTAPIRIFRLNALAEKFSVHCRGCGHRAIYSKRLLCVEEAPERRRKPRRQ